MQTETRPQDENETKEEDKIIMTCQNVHWCCKNSTSLEMRFTLLEVLFVVFVVLWEIRKDLCENDA